MTDRIPVYLMARPQGRLTGVAAALGDAKELIAPEAGAGALQSRPPGVLLVDPGEMTATQLLDVVGSLPADRWTVAAVTTEDPPRVRTVSLGARDSVEDVRRHAADPSAAPGCLLVLERALTEMSRVRHDVNNPLTAAMAEVQLLLMEAPDGEERDSLEAILQQLRRIRDMVGATRHLRPRRD
jgi:signal transduction histidine kinase